ncbi:CGP-CTERM sorting domain-containing protein [Thermococcus stetteri]|uniref:CGP-CTERM sorting domain-containing protein n=1 Tax=Thermococcus stetteri TaxID=49900 RepID=UPI001AE7E460|nr:CGP-CTERM sorting domain-containing protein [Thermococcus stetteri]MBP1912286.1 hypothetical protein [Thermococcus stetteri]
MRKFGFLMVFLVLSGLLAGAVSAGEDYKEVQKNEYIVGWDGSANVTLQTIFYSPEDMVNATKKSIMEMGIENATKMFIAQKVQALAGLGLNLENATGEIIGYDTTGPLTTVIKGRLVNFARYYSYDGVWEITLDALRISDLVRINPAAVNGSIYLENYFTITIPEGAVIKNLTRGFNVESNGSYIKLETESSGRVINVHSVVYLKEGIFQDSLKVLYSELQPVVIAYIGKEGSENYTTWSMVIRNNITVKENETILDTVEEYIEPSDYVNYLKVQFISGGTQNAEQSLYQGYFQQFQAEGIKVLGGNVKLLNLNSTGPLVVKYHWVLQGLVKRVNDSYVYVYDPKLELGTLDFPYRLNAEVNETKITRIILPEGYHFTSIPSDISVSSKAGSVTMRIENVSKREVVITSNVLLRYGVPAEDYKDLMAKVPDKVEFKYVNDVEAGSKSTCGPAFLVGLAVVPLLLRRRK